MWFLVNLPLIINQISAVVPDNGTSSATAKQCSWPAVNRFEFSGMCTCILSLIIVPLVSDLPLISFIDDYNWCRKKLVNTNSRQGEQVGQRKSVLEVGSTMCLLLPAQELTNTEITLL